MSDLDIIVLDIDGGAMLANASRRSPRKRAPARVIVFDNGSRRQSRSASHACCIFSIRNQPRIRRRRQRGYRHSPPIRRAREQRRRAASRLAGHGRAALDRDPQLAAVQTHHAPRRSTSMAQASTSATAHFAKSDTATTSARRSPSHGASPQPRRSIAAPRSASDSSTSASSPTTKTSSSARDSAQRAGARRAAGRRGHASRLQNRRRSSAATRSGCARATATSSRAYIAASAASARCCGRTRGSCCVVARRCAECAGTVQR